MRLSLLIKEGLTAKIAIFSLMTLFLLPNTALATNWVYLQRQEGTRYGACTEYLDTDSVVNEDNKLIYWTIWVIDKADWSHDIGKIMMKKEAPLRLPLRYRTLERYFYNVADVETNRYLSPMGFYGESPEKINRALEYAGEGRENVAKPDHTMTPTSSWYGYEDFADCNLYWDIHSIVAWPRDNPTTAEIIVKWVWNKEGLEKRKAYLMTQRPYPGGYEDISYTLVNYQFSVTESKMKIISIADQNINHKRISFFDEGSWQDVEEGSIDEMARKITLNWISRNDSTLQEKR